MWDAGERQLAHLEDNSERQLRAYISVNNSVIVAADTNGVTSEQPEKIHAGCRPASTIELKNYGHTPAYEVTLLGSIKFIQWPPNPAALIS
jgi:hypothetical protein